MKAYLNWCGQLEAWSNMVIARDEKKAKAMWREFSVRLASDQEDTLIMAWNRVTENRDDGTKLRILVSEITSAHAGSVTPYAIHAAN